MQNATNATPLIGITISTLNLHVDLFGARSAPLSDALAAALKGSFSGATLMTDPSAPTAEYPAGAPSAPAQEEYPSATTAADPALADQGDPTEEAASPAINRENIVAFLSGDQRYTSRTLTAVAKHFGVMRGDDDLADQLSELVGDCVLGYTRRRADGEPLYSVR